MNTREKVILLEESAFRVSGELKLEFCYLSQAEIKRRRLGSEKTVAHERNFLLHNFLLYLIV